MSREELVMTFDPNTIQHLGIKMYSQLPAAVAELVANAYDADASKVYIKLYDNSEGKKIVVQDDGHGMSFTEINNCFLKIGRNRRSENCSKSPKGRIATGKKGLGKLALFGIGNTITILTKKKEKTNGINFSMSWDDIKNTKNGKPYNPKFELIKSENNVHSTTISISQLKRNSNFSVSDSVSDLALSLSKIFNFLDTKFRVFISLNDANEVEVTQDLKYKSFDKQFDWNFPEFSSLVNNNYQQKNFISGQVITTKTPLKPGQRGITLFANGRMVNAPEFFGSSESSHFFSYTTGWLNVNFVDNYSGEEDLISTNRQSLDWEKEETLQLRSFLQEALIDIHKQWREKRKSETKKEVQDITKIDVPHWMSTLPKDKAEAVEKAFDEISDPEQQDNSVQIFTRTIHAIAPEYAELHWRYLHPEIHKVAEEDYQKGHYFKAAREAALLYIQRVRDMAGIDDEHFEKIFNPGNGVLMITDCNTETERNIQTGHQYLSRGIELGCRNPLVHNPEFEKHLKKTGLFNEKTCLDMLAVISHLFTRLDNAKKRLDPLRNTSN